MSAEEVIVRVALLSPPFTELSYLLPEYLPPEAFFVGQRLVVPLGKHLRVGVLLAFEGGAPKSETKNFTLKSLIWPLDKSLLLSASYLDLARQIAKRHLDECGRILSSMLPLGLRMPKAGLRFFRQDGVLDLNPAQLAKVPPAEQKELGLLWLSGQAEIRRPGQSPLDAEFCVLCSDPPWPVRPAAKLQQALLELLFENGAISRRALEKKLGKGAGAALAVLVRRGLARIRPADPEGADDKGRGRGRAGEKFPKGAGANMPPPETANARSGSVSFALSPAQEQILAKLRPAALGGGGGAHLLFGVTGSGKTAVYLDLALRVLESGRSVLLLAPEVALAMKLKDEAEAFLPFSLLPEDRRHFYHGYQSPAVKERLFRLLAGEDAGASRLLIGTRSALLLPIKNLGLIVMDEEHDASFKQDEGQINYSAKEVAWFRAHQEGALLLLGSATPDLKSFYAAGEGAMPLHVLKDRVGGHLPEVRFVKVGKSLAAGADSLPLAPESLEALNDVVRRGEQAVILLNRRGYAPVMYCLDCGKALRCPHCDIALAYHKGRERMICHYCGWSSVFPSPCPVCGGLNFLPLGEGTEKLEEGLASQLPPGTGILRLDRDSARRMERLEEILAAFARKEAQVLVGTQMLSKGHHFPDVTLAVIAGADQGLNLPDYRAAERVFQLILQASGRSGRGDRAGLVLIETRDPEHYCWDYVRNADYEGFFARELALRKERRYPPFVRLGLIRISYAADYARGAEEATALGRSLRARAGELGLTLLGPAPAPLSVLKGRMRRHCLIKGDDWQKMRELYLFARRSLRGEGLSLRLDLDPVNML
ncbi:MAG: primosomal protein N' [Desulfovibrio sp.]|jgi:primosomal protein N' (replication factor Y)|nr:primosomal protein N' [Desulfovibrio sp.]